jgi:hypothetical protein
VTWKTLWNLAADPRETTDVIAWKPEEAARLDAMLTAWADRRPAAHRPRLTRPEQQRLEATMRAPGDL